VNEAVLDASVVLKWFHSEGEAHVGVARRLRAQFEAGELRVLAPQLLWLELLNVAARRWGWPQSQLEQLADTLEQLGFEQVEPELLNVARWAANGLTAYDAAYVAVAEQAGTQLITDDKQIASTAPNVTTALGGLQVPPERDQGT
jgi:predicted nucleic acid-binding protein